MEETLQTVIALLYEVKEKNEKLESRFRKHIEDWKREKNLVRSALTGMKDLVRRVSEEHEELKKSLSAEDVKKISKSTSRKRRSALSREIDPCLSDHDILTSLSSLAQNSSSRGAQSSTSLTLPACETHQPSSENKESETLEDVTAESAKSDTSPNKKHKTAKSHISTSMLTKEKKQEIIGYQHHQQNELMQARIKQNREDVTRNIVPVTKQSMLTKEKKQEIIGYQHHQQNELLQARIKQKWEDVTRNIVPVTQYLTEEQKQEVISYQQDYLNNQFQPRFKEKLEDVIGNVVPVMKYLTEEQKQEVISYQQDYLNNQFQPRFKEKLEDVTGNVVPVMKADEEDETTDTADTATPPTSPYRLTTQEDGNVTDECDASEVSPTRGSCEKCGKKYFRIFRRNRGRWYHSCGYVSPSKYKCHLCDELFLSAEELEIHVLNHSDKKPFCCNKCLKCYRIESDLSLHKLVAHGIDQHNSEK